MLLALSRAPQIVECAPRGGVHNSRGRYTCGMFIDSDVIFSEWGTRNNSSSYERGFARNTSEALA